MSQTSTDKLTAALDSRSPRSLMFDLFAVSFLTLFVELFLIRHLGTEIRVLAYFQNSVLIACFIGLGLGFRYARRGPLRYAWFVPSFSLFYGLVLYGMVSGLVQEAGNPTGGELLWGPASSTRGDIFFYAVFLLTFVVVLALFALLGQLTGNLFVRFESLKSYSINIAGSLAGCIGFTVMSFLGMPPWVWLIASLIPAVWLLRGHSRALVAALTCGVVIIGLFAQYGNAGEKDDREVFWSPYQKVVKFPLVQNFRDGRPPLEVGFELAVNQDYHQRAIDLSDEFHSKYGEISPGLAMLRAVYGFPYVLQPKPERVLVIGAGSGNDVAAALRHGAKYVDAVEIDPVLAALGKEHHAEKPYDDPRVNLIIDDGRAHLRRTDQKYDLIVYGLVDSHTQVSGMIQVRLENFIYTVEGIREAKSRLTENGIIALSFAADPTKSWIARRLYNILEEVFDEPPPLAINNKLGREVMFFGGPGLDLSRLQPGPFEPIQWSKQELDLEPSTDDWPFLYIKERGIPVPYMALIGVIALIFFGIYRGSTLSDHPFSPHFFFLGAAFLLVEVKGITELALAFGTTWLVNGIAFSTILLLILLATIWLIKHPVKSLKPYYIGLWASLAVGFAAPWFNLTALPLGAQQLLAVVFLFIPIFFAAIVFGTSLANADDVEGAFSSNLLGAMVGGFLEYLSLVMGIKTLYIVALLLYVLSAQGILWGKKTST